MNYTIIIPLFNEELNVIKLHDELLKALDNDYFKIKNLKLYTLMTDLKIKLLKRLIVLLKQLFL